jgi:hypothetical protein
MLEYRQNSPASPATVWRLLARPGAWSEWAPHLRGAWGLGEPEVEPGSTGAARVAWVVPVPARITAKEPGRSWRWQVGPYSMVHRVEPRGTGCDVILEVSASGPFERVFDLSYGRVIPALLGRLADAAADSEAAQGASPA